ncbi:MAG TPA: YraN family protein [Caulobacteraceae bacterium]|jgi:putative endonuclease
MSLRGVRAERGAAARRTGRSAEMIAALWLMAKGYRILALRLRTPQAEIDLLARRGPVLAVVEVKRRTSVAAALEAVTPPQRERLVRAARALASRRTSLTGLQIRLDLFALAPNARPRHIAGAWGDDQ